MSPPRKGTITAARYNCLVSARVPQKCNNYREYHEDQHYLFARVAYRREFTTMFHKEAAIFSCDDMNKVKVGPLAVSRYHQIHRYFQDDDKPIYPDHDFPVPRYLLIPSGYMQLICKGSDYPDIPECFTALDRNDISGEDNTNTSDDQSSCSCTTNIHSSSTSANGQPSTQSGSSSECSTPSLSVTATATCDDVATTVSLTLRQDNSRSFSINASASKVIDLTGNSNPNTNITLDITNSDGSQS